MTFKSHTKIAMSHYIKVACVISVIFAIQSNGFGQQTADELINNALKIGAELYETFAPPEFKAQYSFPTRQEWEIFWTAVNISLQYGSEEDLASLAPYAHQALDYMRHIPSLNSYTDWLRQRLDYFDAAVPPPTPSTPKEKPVTWSRMPTAPVQTSKPKPLKESTRNINTWNNMMKNRKTPAGANTIIPMAKEIFKEEGVPPELAWIAEVESSLNPKARSPAGAVGLFQFMPATAERFGMKLTPEDERNNPEKSAKAAAQYLRFLHNKFGSWPLAIAAYNCGEGRLNRAIQQHQAGSFEEIAGTLPSETQMYVPKVLAIVSLRENIDPKTIPPPHSPL